MTWFIIRRPLKVTGITCMPATPGILEATSRMNEAFQSINASILSEDMGVLDGPDGLGEPAASGAWSGNDANIWLRSVLSESPHRSNQNARFFVDVIIGTPTSTSTLPSRACSVPATCSNQDLERPARNGGCVKKQRAPASTLHLNESTESVTGFATAQRSTCAGISPRDLILAAASMMNRLSLSSDEPTLPDLRPRSPPLTHKRAPRTPFDPRNRLPDLSIFRATRSASKHWAATVRMIRPSPADSSWTRCLIAASMSPAISGPTTGRSG
mmetsp:Transcript_9415/g.25517  ORF Transcript_9415/g.25517 Transcript_9415/m.25517 type:complete len:271 (+) Transcript_9415:542-1354(+)